MTKERRSRTDRHLTRKELLKAAGQEEATADHLQACVECREAVALLKAFQVAGRPLLPEPPQAWVERAIDIPERSWRTQVLTRIKAVITFDSWLQPSPVGVRGIETSGERRVCCEAGPFLIDLRAEKHRDAWRMVAQLSGEGAETAELHAGSQIVPSDSGSMFQWSSPRPPLSINVCVGKNTIELPKLSWKRPRKT